MKPDLSLLTIAATKPRGKIAKMLVDAGLQVVPIREDEGNVDRYVLSKRLVVERRTGGGFIKGIMEKTLFTSAIYLREHYRIPVFIVEGKVNYAYSMIDPQAVRGAMSSMLIQYGMNVLATPDAEETVELLIMMARQEQIGIPEISLIPKRKAVTVVDMQRRLMEMLPGCGRVMARELLQQFGSVKRIVDASKEELISLRGIGTRKAAQMIDVLNTEYKAVDTEKNLEDAIEFEPRLLFRKPPDLLARQHHIYTDEKERHIVDLVYVNKKNRHLILVELKRGALTIGSYHQICRYLDHAHQSVLLKEQLDKGMKLRGIIATVEKSDLACKRPEISTRQIDPRRVIKVLAQIRRRRWGQKKSPTGKPVGETCSD